MIAVKARILTNGETTPVVPITIPDLDDVRQFASKLHSVGETWSGEVFGWSAEYNPERPEPPLDSNMTFTPADFSIGESGIWFFSMMWEHGRSNDPVEYLDDRNILRGEPFMALIEHSRTRQKAQGGIPSAKMGRRLGVG